MRVLSISLLTLLAGCASVSTQLPDISIPQLTSEQSKQEALALDDLEILHARLMRVAAPIMAANPELCPKTRLDIGVTTHEVKSYAKQMREAARRELGAKTYPTVFHVRPGSSGGAAGLRRGDVLLDNNDIAMTPSSQDFQKMLATSPEAIRVRRKDEIKTVSVEPVKICSYDLRLSQTGTINAYANGKAITVTSGMMNFVKNDEELALIIGHELGHNTMGHIRKIVSNIILSMGGTRYTRPFESEADYVGMYYMVRAGYDPDNVEDVWRRLAVTNPKSVARAKTHPTYPDRYLRIAATRDEIKAKQDAGLPLLPNFKTGDGDKKS